MARPAPEYEALFCRTLVYSKRAGPPFTAASRCSPLSQVAQAGHSSPPPGHREPARAPPVWADRRLRHSRRFSPFSPEWGLDSTSTSPSPGVSRRSSYIGTPLSAPRGRMGDPDCTPYTHRHPPLVVHLGGERNHLGILRRDRLVVSHEYGRRYWREGLTVRVLQWYSVDRAW